MLFRRSFAAHTYDGICRCFRDAATPSHFRASNDAVIYATPYAFRCAVRVFTILIDFEILPFSRCHISCDAAPVLQMLSRDYSAMLIFTPRSFITSLRLHAAMMPAYYATAEPRCRAIIFAAFAISHALFTGLLFIPSYVATRYYFAATLLFFTMLSSRHHTLLLTCRCFRHFFIIFHFRHETLPLSTIF